LDTEPNLVFEDKLGKYSVNPWSTVEVAIRALPQERFGGLPFAGFRSRAGLHCLSGLQ